MDASQTDAYVSFNEVQKSYDGENLVVKDLNLGVQRGEFMTMLGPSGSGKTTCLTPCKANWVMLKAVNCGVNMSMHFPWLIRKTIPLMSHLKTCCACSN